MQSRKSQICFKNLSVHRRNRLDRFDFYDDLIVDDNVGPKANVQFHVFPDHRHALLSQQCSVNFQGRIDNYAGDFVLRHSWGFLLRGIYGFPAKAQRTPRNTYRLAPFVTDVIETLELSTRPETPLRFLRFCGKFLSHCSRASCSFSNSQTRRTCRSVVRIFPIESRKVSLSFSLVCDRNALPLALTPCITASLSASSLFA